MADETLNAETSRESRDRYAFIATALFAGQAIWALAHLLMGGRYHALTRGTDIVVDVVLTLTWATAAFASASRWRAIALAPLVGCAASFAHGIMSSVSAPYTGIPFLLAGIAATYCTFRAMPLFDRDLPKSLGEARARLAMPRRAHARAHA